MTKKVLLLFISLIVSVCTFSFADETQNDSAANETNVTCCCGTTCDCESMKICSKGECCVQSECLVKGEADQEIDPAQASEEDTQE